MRVESVDRVIERMDEAMNGVARPVITSDADGTLWTGDVGEDAFVELVEGGLVREACRDALAEEASAAGLTTTGDANQIARAIYAAYSRGTFDEARCYQLMAWVFAGFTPDEVRSFAARLQEKTNLTSRLHPEMQAIVRWAQKRSVEFWVVSASPRFVVQTGAARFGIPPERVVGTCPLVVDGRVAPRLAEPMPYGRDKAAAIARTIGPSRVIGAFGNDVFDVEMMLSSDVPVAVRPADRLRARVVNEPTVVELGH